MKTSTLSKSEIEVMAALWRLGSGTVATVQKDLQDSDPEQRKIAYTTVATHLTRMVEKGAVRARKEGRSYLYEPTEKRADYQLLRLGDMVRQFFDGRPSSLASRFIESNSFSSEELEELRHLIDKKKPK
ncbi:MAG: BlaI/MecI/CopY family transcriptional regulator [Roseibium sp.]|uniref:BlaI/MecI/CopY family transcriptional regulator n=1 Tax=Roseibium sp. TaxID=1936156 RepID=UPI00261289C5|nr:BlaI/MecI/CopY family transcriptional regulator [Roseibium sp.]MCV0423931.1 BlaI/MecI/CopY family transcriptional regulator [Roseibium sp.]